MILSVDAEKGLDKIQHLFMIKNSQKIKNRGELPQCVKDIYKQPTANIILNKEKLKAFQLR